MMVRMRLKAVPLAITSGRGCRQASRGHFGRFLVEPVGGTNDSLTFTIDGTPQFLAKGAQDWRWDGFYIPDGVHTLKWEYTKNAIARGWRGCGMG